MARQQYEQRSFHGKRRAVHVLLMEEILGRPLKENEVVHHINEDKLDNRPENLMVMDRAEHNALHHQGTKASPEKIRKISISKKGKPGIGRKLSREQVREIAERLCKGETSAELSREYGLAVTSVRKIRDGLFYRDCLPDYPDDAFPLGKKEIIRKPLRANNRKFGVKEVTDIRIRLLENEAAYSIAKSYDVKPETINAIRDNLSYQDIPWPVEVMRLHRTDDMIKLAMLMLSLPLNPDKPEYTALVEDYAIAPDWQSVTMLRLLKRAAAGDREIAMLLLAMAGYGEGIDRAIAEESQIVQTMLHLGDEKKLIRKEETENT